LGSWGPVTTFERAVLRGGLGRDSCHADDIPTWPGQIDGGLASASVQQGPCLREPSRRDSKTRIAALNPGKSHGCSPRRRSRSRGVPISGSAHSRSWMADRPGAIPKSPRGVDLHAWIRPWQAHSARCRTPTKAGADQGRQQARNQAPNQDTIYYMEAVSSRGRPGGRREGNQPAPIPGHVHGPSCRLQLLHERRVDIHAEARRVGQLHHALADLHPADNRIRRGQEK
jgi:hypothetical protein